jgi:hypothetical protein
VLGASGESALTMAVPTTSFCSGVPGATTFISPSGLLATYRVPSASNMSPRGRPGVTYSSGSWVVSW